MAVRAADALIGILNVSVPEPRLNEQHERLVTQCLREAVRRLEERLGQTGAH